MKKNLQNNIELQSEKPEKNFSEKIGLSSVPVKSNNFPAKGRRRSYPKILPSHRAIYQNYKDNGFMSLGKAIRKTNVYSESVITRTHNITKSKSWKLLLDEKLPQDKLARVHSELLDKRDVRKVIDDDGSITEIDDGPNTAAATKALELAYRLRGAFKEQASSVPSTVMYNMFYKPEVRAQMKTFEDGLKQTLINEIAKKNQKDIEHEENIRIVDAETEDSGT